MRCGPAGGAAPRGRADAPPPKSLVGARLAHQPCIERVAWILCEACDYFRALCAMRGASGQIREFEFEARIHRESAEFG